MLKTETKLARVWAALVLALLSAVCAQAQRRGEYTNPVMAGDFPDPSVTRLGRDYYAAATTSEWGPEFPVLHSRDLINWRVVGAVFENRPAWATGSFWAPEITQYRGRFYVYYVARKKDGPLCVAVATSQRATGPYKDHGPLVCQQVGSIDGFPLTDENGDRVLLWKEDSNSVSRPTIIWAQTLSADGTKLVGERKEVLRNTQGWEKHAFLPFGDLVEGPSVVRHGGWFYMFYSGNFCCGRDCNYALGVARSKTILGPWEKYDKNPILTGNDAWKCPGHGTVVEDGRGRYFLMYHAYHPKDFVYVGRQAMLDEVKFGADGWPTINEGRGPSASAAAPFGGHELNAEYRVFDDFTSPRLDPAWQWPQSSVPAFRVERARGGWLSLAPAAGAPAGVMARTTTTGDYEATTSVETRGLTGARTAGLAAFGDMENALGLIVGDGRVTLWRREKNEPHEVASADAPAGASLQLRMRAREGHLYRFSFSRDGRNWTDVGEELDGAYLPPWDRGVRVALVTTGAGGARFGFLRVEPSK